jgi:hypothetical protein
MWWMVGAMLVLAACSGRASRPADGERAAPAPAAEAKRVPPPAGSPLAKVKEGMGMREVSDLLGQPSDQHSYVTGKAWIPYYYGDDMARIQWHYKGMGRVIFSGGGPYGQEGGKVQWVEYDPAESGYRR